MKLDKAILAAMEEGLSVFSVTMHVGGSCEFLEVTWEGGAFTVDKDGNPLCDHLGNTVAKFSVRPIDPAIDGKLCREWYGE
jgi:hypothetical protein